MLADGDQVSSRATGSPQAQDSDKGVSKAKASFGYVVAEARDSVGHNASIKLVITFWHHCIDLQAW